MGYQWNKLSTNLYSF